MTTVLTRPTLILNRNWQPVGVATVARSLILVYSDNARVVDPHDYRQYTWADWSALSPAENESFVQTLRYKLRVPEVVSLTRYDRVPQHNVTFSRRNLFKRDRYTCQYCGVQPGGEELTIDHVLPRSRGGTSTWTNCVLACLACNKRKADRTPDEARMRLPHVPVRPHWRPYYAEQATRIASWSKFLNEAYWSVQLES